MSMRSKWVDWLGIELTELICGDRHMEALEASSSKHLARTVSSKKRIHPLSKRDRGTSYALGDACALYKPVTTVIGQIGKEVPMSSNLA
ncbi:UNVERIFIED_CONTAM: hypothetical protein Sindi_2479400 [Sesamum indicum]